MISLKDITEDNFDAIIKMKRPDGEKWLASNAYSLAQAWLYRENNDVFPYAIYNDDIPVGFCMLEDDLEEKELWIWRIMFPEENANKGYGSETLRLIIKQARESGKYDMIGIDSAIGNTRAKHVYEKVGFVATGEIVNGNEEVLTIVFNEENL